MWVPVSFFVNDKYFCKNIEIQLDNWGKYVYNIEAWLNKP